MYWLLKALSLLNISNRLATVLFIVGQNDLTVIPGIGKATAAKLAAAGIHTFTDLLAASDEVLLQFVHRSALETIKAWTPF